MAITLNAFDACILPPRLHRVSILWGRSRRAQPFAEIDWAIANFRFASQAAEPEARDVQRAGKVLTVPGEFGRLIGGAVGDLRVRDLAGLRSSVFWVKLALSQRQMVIVRYIICSL